MRRPKVVLYMAITPNGMIAKENDNTSFVMPGDWQLFIRTAKKIGNMVVGKRTFDVIINEGELKRFKGVNIIPVTHNQIRSHRGFDINPANSPEDAVRFLRNRGFKQVLVAGGGTINALFMKRNLIDEILLDVQPSVFTKGIRVFDGPDFEAKLKLLNLKRISKNEVQLHYKVIR